MPDKQPTTPPEQPKEPLNPREKLDQMKAKMERIRQSKNAAEKEALKNEATELKRQMEQEAKDQEAAEAQGILKEIERLDAPAPAAADPLVAKVEKASSGMERIQQNLSKVLNNMSTGTLRALYFVAGIFGFKAEFLLSKIDVSDIRDMMSKKLGKNISRTPEDEVMAKDLRAQYLIKLEKDKKNPNTYPFETFVLQKIEELKATGEKPDYTIADLTNIPSEEKVEAEKKKEETKKEEEKKKETTNAQKKMKDAIEKDPKLEQAVYTAVLGKALQTYIKDLTINKAKLTPEALLADNEGIDEAKKLAKDITKSLENGKSKKTFGIELDGGDLEETDGTNWVDYDIIPNFDPEGDPHDAVKKLLSLDVEKTSMNTTAKTRLPELQDALKKYLAEYGLEPA